MLRLDLDLIRHALQTAADRGFATVEIGLGEDSFEATFQPRKGGASATPKKTLAETEEAATKTITAPSVGYFRPGATPISVGQEVKAGDVVGEIVALGLKNEVVAKWSGTVTQILVLAEQPVEYGQALVSLRI